MQFDEQKAEARHIRHPFQEMFAQVVFHLSVVQVPAPVSECAGGAAAAGGSAFGGFGPRAVVVEERPRVEQVFEFDAVVFPQVVGQEVGPPDVAPDDFGPDVGLNDVGAGDFKGRLVVVGTHQEEGVFLEHGTAQGALLDHVEQVDEEGAVAAAHIHDAFGLRFDGLVEQVDDDVVHHLKIIGMRAAASPHVHFAVHVHFACTGWQVPKDVGVAKNQFIDLPEHGQVRNRDSVGAGAARKKQAFVGKLVRVVAFLEPAEVDENIEQAFETIGIFVELFRLEGSFHKVLVKHAVHAQGYERRPNDHAFDVFQDLVLKALGFDIVGWWHSESVLVVGGHPFEHEEGFLFELSAVKIAGQSVQVHDVFVEWNQAKGLFAQGIGADSDLVFCLDGVGKPALGGQNAQGHIEVAFVGAEMGGEVGEQHRFFLQQVCGDALLVKGKSGGCGHEPIEVAEQVVAKLGLVYFVHGGKGRVGDKGRESWGREIIRRDLDRLDDRGKLLFKAQKAAKQSLKYMIFELYVGLL